MGHHFGKLSFGAKSLSKLKHAMISEKAFKWYSNGYLGKNSVAHTRLSLFNKITTTPTGLLALSDKC